MVWEPGRLAFERLQQSLARRRGTGALAAARAWPAHLVVLDVPRLDGRDLTTCSDARRRNVVAYLFADAGAVRTVHAGTVDHQPHDRP